MDQDRIFKNTEEDIEYNKRQEAEEKYNKIKKRIQITLYSIIGTTILLFYFIAFFSKIYPLSIGEAKVGKQSKDYIEYSRSYYQKTEYIKIYGTPNQSPSASIVGIFLDETVYYKITFSNPEDWGTGKIVIYNQEDEVIYENYYKDSRIDIWGKGTWNQEDYMINTAWQDNYQKKTMVSVTKGELVELAFRDGIRFKGNVISLFIIIYLCVMEVISILFWEKIFIFRTKIWMMFNTSNNYDDLRASDWYEAKVRIGQIIIAVLILLEMFRAFTW